MNLTDAAIQPFSHNFVIGMGEFAVAFGPLGVITAYGLGSCVMVTLYDPVVRIGGAIHIVLPDSTAVKNKDNPAKFADTGIPLLLNKVVEAGARRERIMAKAVGGAQVLASPGGASVLDIGARNARAAVAALEALKIPLVSSDLGGTDGRTAQFMLADGSLVVRRLGKGEKKL